MTRYIQYDTPTTSLITSEHLKTVFESLPENDQYILRAVFENNRVRGLGFTSFLELIFAAHQRENMNELDRRIYAKDRGGDSGPA